MQRNPAFPLLLTALTVLATVAVLLMMGRNPICPCGYVDLWGATGTEEGSQQLLDWYTPSHLIHGFLFYAALWLVARPVPIGWRLLVATLVECGWEIVENSNAVIERYREVTIALDYYGDSVLNSVSDIVAMFIGFWLSMRLPVWLSVVIVIGFEILTAFIIRDGLVLNVLMLLYPVDAIRDWQGAI
ncbi:DUF2585 domain-containing protein [Roseovarius sp. E0-M6]|uniref:DUF2585 domain-containing protein n=1 Tax=Roseovarius sp. E0-M6 TaxID=3127118 RepID=UPI00300FFEE5